MPVIESVHHRFHDDHCAINDETKIQGPKAHQVSRHPKHIHHPDGEHHGQRDHGSYDETGAQVAKKQYEDHHYNKRTFQQIFLHRINGPVHDLGAIIKGNELYTFRKGFPDFVDFYFY